MECPRCHLLLKKILVDENIYYKCPQCEGTLVHADRLRSLAEYTILELHIPEQPINPNHQEEVISPFALKEQAITCPYCQTETQLVNYGYDSNVIIEKCPACNTVWLDKDELLQIAKHLRGNTTLQRYGAALADVTEEQVRGAEEDQPNFIPAAVQSTIIPVPIGDERATKHPIIVYTIIGITSLLFFWQTFSGTNTENVFLTYGFVPALASNGERLFTLVTSLFFHVDIFH
ncbi:zf-TFIIB domain-containing protein, partial [candidate division WWE3 bacterium]|nr:zf-TFIIB domain-containing protein [candidate division WWE3 bacterium]